MQFLNLTQNTQEWEQFRQQKIGASDAPIIMEVSPWKTPFQLWLEKTGQSTSVQNHHMMRGHALEESARAAFEKATNLIVFPRVVQSMEHEWNLLPAHSRDSFRDSLGVDDATWKRGRGWALSNALIALPYYKDTNPTLANNARHVIQEVIEEGRKGIT